VNDKFLHIFLWSFVPIFDTGNQIFMKFLGLKMGTMEFGFNWLFLASASLYFWAAIFCDFCSFFAWMLILKRTNISKAVPISSICYITILIASCLVFNEQIILEQAVGIIFIMSGIILIGLKDHLPQ
jgi:drug/metabolite transporter (DMT)-like permease